MRIACDVGGTFTDLLVEDGPRLRMFKAPTTPDDPAAGVLAAIDLAARDAGQETSAFLARAHTFIHATTRAINAILTGGTARTAFITTAGHRDILVIREGGRIEPFNFTVPYPDPYVPRALTFTVPERIDSAGRVLVPLDEGAARAVVARLAELRIEAVAVCLLWSIANPAHEERLGELLAAGLPGVPVTLSHRSNTTLREYRRSISACLDASLKPLMQSYLSGLVARLGEAGFHGRTLMVTSQGSVMDAAAMAEAPIHAINSGPSMAPVAGGHFARADADADTAVVADTGGTSYDVSLVREGTIPWTRETWLGQPYRGDMTGFPSVDVRSIGAGGGSIAWVDRGGLLHVGPRSAGSVPGPACYGAGGVEPTVTDCALVLGMIDPAYFLGGTVPLDADAAQRAVRERVAGPLGLGLAEAAAAVLSVTTEKMVGAIGDITVGQGIDPSGTVLVGGGGAAGLNCVAIARRLGCRRVVVPAVGAALSAAGALMSDLGTEFARMSFTTAGRFDADRVNGAFDGLTRRCRDFILGPGRDAGVPSITLSVEARYPHQIWELDVPLRAARFEGSGDIERLVADFHAQHRAIFAIDDPGSDVEFVTWRARVRCRLARGEGAEPQVLLPAGRPEHVRTMYVPSTGWTEVQVLGFESLSTGQVVPGPAIIESAYTTVVVDPGANACRAPSGGLIIDIEERRETAP